MKQKPVHVVRMYLNAKPAILYIANAVTYG